MTTETITAVATDSSESNAVSRSKARKEPRKRTIAARIKSIYGSFETQGQNLQGVLIDVITTLQPMSKRDVLKDLVWEQLFKNTPKPIDRGTLSAWVTAFTPVRVKFDKQTGVYLGVTWASKGAWDIKGGAKTYWAEVDPERTRVLKAPELDRAMASFAKEIAKQALLSHKSARALADSLVKDMASNNKLADLVAGHMAKANTQDWVDDYRVQVEEQKQQ